MHPRGQSPYRIHLLPEQRLRNDWLGPKQIPKYRRRHGRYETGRLGLDAGAARPAVEGRDLSEGIAGTKIAETNYLPGLRVEKYARTALNYKEYLV